MNALYHTEGNVCAKVKITATGGKEFVETSICPSGSPEKFLSEDAICHKFLALAEPVLGNGSRQLLDLLQNLEDLDDLDRLATLMRPMGFSSSSTNLPAH